MIIDIEPCCIKKSDDNMIIVGGLPVFRVVGGCFEFIDKDKLRCKARGGNRVRVKVVDLVAVMRS